MWGICYNKSSWWKSRCNFDEKQTPIEFVEYEWLTSLITKIEDIDNKKEGRRKNNIKNAWIKKSKRNGSIELLSVIKRTIERLWIREEPIERTLYEKEVNFAAENKRQLFLMWWFSQHITRKLKEANVITLSNRHNTKVHSANHFMWDEKREREWNLRQHQQRDLTGNFYSKKVWVREPRQ